MNDGAIRRVIFDYLEENTDKIRIFEESPIKSSRCDFYTVTDCLTGYEIKSDADSFERLAGQIKNYDLFFDENYLVVGRTHELSAKKKIPEYWGLISISDEDEGFVVSIVRKASDNPKRKRKNQISKLWNSEITAILKRNGVHVHAGKSKSFRADVMIKNIDDGKLREEICRELFERDYNREE